MMFNRERHHRQSTRLRGYDYASVGAYFLTLCTHQSQCLFGSVVDGEMVLSPLGQIVEEEWLRSSELREEIELDVFVVMPNHFHALVWILQPQAVGATGQSPLPGQLPLTWFPGSFTSAPGPRPKSVGSLMTGFKTSVTKRVRPRLEHPTQPVWQRNYHDQIIRNEAHLERVREYITLNPGAWGQDRQHLS